MRLYAFSSASLTNIWAGVGAQLWAVPQSASRSSNAGRSTKAAKMLPGSVGLLYSSADKCFTSPFIVHSVADPKAVIEHVWPGKWILPFGIRTIGNPHVRLSWSDAAKVLPSCIDGIKLNRLIHVEPLTVFSASEISEADWALLISKLAI